MNAIETSGKQSSGAAVSPASNVSCTDPVGRQSPPDALVAEDFSNALNRRPPLPADADSCDDHLFDVLAQLRWPDSTQGQAKSATDATLKPVSTANDEICCAVAPQLSTDIDPALAQTLYGQHLPAQSCSSDTEPALAQTMHGQHLPVQERSSDTEPPSEVTLRADRKISRKTKEVDDDRVPDAPSAILHFTPHPPAAVDPAAAQAAYSDPARSELRMQEFHQLVCQIGAQVAIDSRRSEIAVSLSHAMFSSTRLKIRGDKDAIEVGYECGSAEETDWFGSHAEALVQRLSTSLQRRVTIRPDADQSAT